MNLEKIVLELLGRIQNLEERVDRLERTDRAVSEEKRSFPADDISNKYRPLAEYLFDKNEKKIIMTYKEIEEILGLRCRRRLINIHSLSGRIRRRILIRRRG